MRAYNEINLYSKKSVERFKIFIGFRNRVCSNLMLTTDGLQDKIEVLSVQELYAAALNLFHAYNPSKDLHLLRTLGQMSISTSEFCQIIGRMRLYQALTPNQQKRLPRLLLGDSQINAACRAFVSDANFKSTGDSITGWQLLNLLNGSVKSSYIDNFLERNLNCTEFVQGLSLIHILAVLIGNLIQTSVNIILMKFLTTLRMKYYRGSKSSFLLSYRL